MSTSRAWTFVYLFGRVSQPLLTVALSFTPDLFYKPVGSELVGNKKEKNEKTNFNSVGISNVI
jgi:hypothetical protein